MVTLNREILIMKFQYQILSEFEKVFCSEQLNIEIPLVQSITQVFDGVRGGTITFQVAFKSQASMMLKIAVQSSLKDFLTIREVQNVPCELPVLPGDTFYLNNQPGLYPNPLVPMGNLLKLPANLWKAMWVSIKIPKDFSAGIYDLNFTFSHVDLLHGMIEKDDIHETCQIKIKVHSAILPEQKLICTNWFYADCLSEFYHEPPWSEHFWEILKNYFHDMTNHGCNMLYTPLWTVPLDTAVNHERPTCQLLDIEYDGNYSFDFAKLKRYIDLGKECGFKYFEMSHFFTQWGAKFTPKIMVNENGKAVRKFGWHVEAVSIEYQKFLNALLPELCDFLRQEKLSGKCYFHISDEPEEEVIENYKNASNLIHNYLSDEEFPIIDALSSPKFFQEGLIKRPVAWTLKLDEFQKEDIEHRWCYFALAPNNAPVRSYGTPSCRYRILGILLYLYEIEGFLHWGHNFWFSKFSLRTDLNPWYETTSDNAHTGGHSYNVYPLNDETPADSIHYETFMKAIEDIGLLQLLESKIGRKQVVDLICQGLSSQPTMTNYPHEAIWQWDLHKRILAMIDQNEDIVPPLT